MLKYQTSTAANNARYSAKRASASGGNGQRDERRQRRRAERRRQARSEAHGRRARNGQGEHAPSAGCEDQQAEQHQQQ